MLDFPNNRNSIQFNLLPTKKNITEICVWTRSFFCSHVFARLKTHFFERIETLSFRWITQKCNHYSFTESAFFQTRIDRSLNAFVLLNISLYSGVEWIRTWIFRFHLPDTIELNLLISESKWNVYIYWIEGYIFNLF